MTAQTALTEMPVSSTGVNADGAGLHPGEQREPAAGAVTNVTPASNVHNNDISQQTSKPNESIICPANWSPNKEKRKRGRLFFALKSGQILHSTAELRFLTLTSAPDSPKDMKYSFNRLVQEIRRQTPRKLHKGGYINDSQLINRFAPDFDRNLLIEYCGCRTSEGYGVIHVLLAGDFLPVRWLRETWQNIHGAHHLNIQLVKKKTASKVSGYILSQYITEQDFYIRGFCSRGWLYPGARKEFKDLIKHRQEQFGYEAGFKLAIQEWENLLWLKVKPSEIIENEREAIRQQKARIEHKRVMKGGKLRYLPELEKSTSKREKEVIPCYMTKKMKTSTLRTITPKTSTLRTITPKMKTKSKDLRPQTGIGEC